jgi:hypothetical protein
VEFERIEVVRDIVSSLFLGCRSRFYPERKLTFRIDQIQRIPIIGLCGELCGRDSALDG